MCTNKKPDFIVYTTTASKEGDKTFYHQIGAAWNVDKGGIGGQLFANPVDGNFVLFPPKEKPDNQQG
jgi:hypothetical protein